MAHEVWQRYSHSRSRLVVLTMSLQKVYDCMGLAPDPGKVALQDSIFRSMTAGEIGVRCKAMSSGALWWAKKGVHGMLSGPYLGGHAGSP